MPLDLTRIRALCFDIDGTLRDTDDQLAQQLAGLLRPLDFILSGERTHLYARRLVMTLDEPGNAIRGLLDTLHLDGPLARLGDRLSKSCDKPSAKPPLIVPGVHSMLEALSHHFPLAVVSARHQRSSQAFLDCHHLSHFFRVIVTGQTCEHTKPYPDPILWAARQMEVPPEQCLMIGDTTVDIRAGRAAGAQTVGVLCGFGQQSELRRAGADLILPTTAMLTNVLLSPGS